jgi:hypothetical protein
MSSPIRLFVNEIADKNGYIKPDDSIYKFGRTTLYKLENPKDKKTYVAKIIEFTS